MGQPKCILVRFSLEAISADLLEKLMKESYKKLIGETDAGDHPDLYAFSKEIPELPGITLDNCRWYPFTDPGHQRDFDWLLTQIAWTALKEGGDVLPKYFAFIKEGE